MNYQRPDIINYATDDHLQHMRRSDISCRYRICQIPLLIQQEGYGVEAVEAVARQLPETWEREGTRRVALAARCILEPPSAETESLSYSAMESEPS